MSLPTTDPNLHIVQESWESDPVNPTAGRWVYTVCQGIEVVAEYRWYSAALRAADRLNAQRTAKVAS